METKTCSDCGETKPVDQFYSTYKKRAQERFQNPTRRPGRAPTGTPGLRRQCKPCCNIRSKKYVHKPPPPDHYRKSNLKRKYGLTLDQYEQMIEAQKGLCAICGQPEKVITHTSKRPRRLSVDHDPSTGRVRGLLCTCCNNAIGALQHKEEILLAAIKYLRETNGD